MDLVLLHSRYLYIRHWLIHRFNPYFNGSSTSTLLLFQFLIAMSCVSILILMDLVLLLVSLSFGPIFFIRVSILILMDLVLLQYNSLLKGYHTNVSILILMDLVLLRINQVHLIYMIMRFNPYFNGSSTSTLFY